MILTRFFNFVVPDIPKKLIIILRNIICTVYIFLINHIRKILPYFRHTYFNTLLPVYIFSGGLVPSKLPVATVASRYLHLVVVLCGEGRPIKGRLYLV